MLEVNSITKKLPSGRKRTLDPKGSKSILIKLGLRDTQAMDQFRAFVWKTFRVRLSRSWIFREGSKQLMSRLRRDMRKAQRGELHAKKRKDW